ALITTLIACSSNEGATQAGSGGAPSSAAHGASVGPESSASSAETASASTGLPPVGDGLGAAQFGPGDLDSPSNGGTITFQQMGAPGWSPSRRDPASGGCDALKTDTCCLAKENITSDALTPWDQDLIMTLRGPMDVKQFATYQPDPKDASQWQLVSG